jgi:3-hydroxyisobutyrate dehydrogenase-like beta-hydroxyacid dehydrogenase
MKVGVVGLGTMGAPMARHLIEAGHDVTVWNRTQAKEEPLAALGAARASTPAEVAQGAHAVLTCVSDDPDIEAVVYGASGVASTLAPGSVLVDSSTVSPSIARSLASRLAEGGLAGYYIGVAEGMALAEKFGLPSGPLLEALGAGAADSWVLRNRTVSMINETYPLGFRTSLHSRTCGSRWEAESLGARLDVAQLVARIEESLIAADFGDEDVSNVARHVRGQDEI